MVGLGSMMPMWIARSILDRSGHNDPTVGCGLSVAMRDARLVRDLILNGARRSIDFESYGTERMERMRRLYNLADVVNLGAQLIMK